MKKDQKRKGTIMPLGDRVLVKPEEMEKKTSTGIIIPDNAKQEKSTRGTIVAVGSGRMNDEGKVLPLSVKVGQHVYFNPGWENEIEIDDEKYYLIHESDVKGIIK